MSGELVRGFHPGKRRPTPIPVPPPRIPTPMPLSNNNNPTRSVHSKDQNTKSHPPSVGPDIPKLITKASYKLLDNDVKTAWINPRLISKIDLEVIKSTEYVPPPESNMNGGHYSHIMSHHNQSCGRAQRGAEWESSVNGRTKSRSTAVAVPAPTPAAADGKRKRQIARPQTQMDGHERLINSRGLRPPKTEPRGRNQRAAAAAQRNAEKVKGVVGYQSACYVGGGGMHDGAVYGVYSETKYTFAVNGMPGTSAQASAAAAFFARAAQKLNLSSSPHRRKRYNSEESDSSGFCGVLQRSPPPVPPALLRRIGVKEVTGVGKVKVMLRVSNPPIGSDGSSNTFFSLDKRKKQVNLIDPVTCGSSSAPEDRRVGVAAPKMFAFDAIFSQDDSQTEICSSALTDVIHAVINGNDGCLFCFGHAGLGKSYTMLGTPDNANTLGIIPCAISWLFKGINEQKQKTGARFSVRVSAVEVSGPTNQMRDLLAGYANGIPQWLKNGGANLPNDRHQQCYYSGVTGCLRVSFYTEY